MVCLLEKYASNLEEIVAHRTKELVDEKERTDRLVHQLLPRLYARNSKKSLNKSYYITLLNHYKPIAYTSVVVDYENRFGNVPFIFVYAHQ